MISAAFAISSVFSSFFTVSRASSSQLIDNVNGTPMQQEYELGLQSEMNTLWSPSPCGADLSTIHEAPSVLYNYWTDDAAKTIGALAYAYPYDESYANGLLSFINANTFSGYVTSRCNQVIPQIVNSNLTNFEAKDQLYTMTGNPLLQPTNQSQHFTVHDNEDPSLSEAYFQAAVASINGTQIHLDTGESNPITDGGFSNIPTFAPAGPWAGTGTNDTIFSHSQGNTCCSLVLKANQQENQTIRSSLIQPPTSEVLNATLWAANNSTSPQAFTVTFTYTDSTSSVFPENMISTTVGNWTLYTISGNLLTSGKSIENLKITANSTNTASLWFDDVGIAVHSSTPSFKAYTTPNGCSVILNTCTVVMAQSVLYDTANVTLNYYMLPNAEYIEENTTIVNTSVNSILSSPTIYNAFDGLSSINAGYAWVYFPGSVGWERANQTQVNRNYQPATGSGGWNQNWMALGIHDKPDWIGNMGIFIDFAQNEMPSADCGGCGGGPWTVSGLLNTIDVGPGVVPDYGYLNWFELSMNDPSILAGQSSTYSLKYVFMEAYDYTNMGVYSTFFNQNNLNNYNNRNLEQNYLYGEIADELAVYYAASGNASYYNTASTIWNYYYRMINSETNGTYTTSLTSFVNASRVLYLVTGNSTYLNGMNWGANKLLGYQQTAAYYSNTTADYFHYDPSVSTINTVSVYGNIFNSTQYWGNGHVYSGTNAVTIGFFLNPPYPRSWNLTGTMTTLTYFNANSTISGTWNTKLSYVSSTGVTTAITTSQNSSLSLSAGYGSGKPPFARAISNLTLSNAIIPAGATLELTISASVSNHQTIFMCVDSRVNCQSGLTIPLNGKAIWQGEWQIPVSHSASTLSAPQFQPYFLDLTAEGGLAMRYAYEQTGNLTYKISYTNALNSFHWGVPPSGVTESNPIVPRIWNYENLTSADTDFGTYKAAGVSRFVEGLNNTLANIAMSRVMDREVDNSTWVQFDTQETSFEMNSETQPWCLIASWQYVAYETSLAITPHFVYYGNFQNLHDVIESFASTTNGNFIVDTLTVNGSASDIFYMFDNGLGTPSSATFNSQPIIATYYASGGLIPGSSYVVVQEPLAGLGTYVLSWSKGSIGVGGGSLSVEPVIINVYPGSTGQGTMTISDTGTSAILNNLEYPVLNNGRVFLNTTSSLPLIIDSARSFLNIGASAAQGTAPGDYTGTATAQFEQNGNSVSVSFQITVNVLSGTNQTSTTSTTTQPLFLNGVFDWFPWILAIVLIILVGTTGYVIQKRRYSSQEI